MTDDEDEDPKEDPNEEHEPENEDAKEDESSKDTDETEPFEENETVATPPPPRSPQTRIPFSQTRLRRARKTVRLEPPMPASIKARITEHAVAPIPPTIPTYDQAPLGHRAAMIRLRDDISEEDMPPQMRFVLTAPPPGCDIAESFAAAARASRGYCEVAVHQDRKRYAYLMLHDYWIGGVRLPILCWLLDRMSTPT
ncbi:hypothetical protein Tco_1199136 [Tanacetum coccineum]